MGDSFPFFFMPFFCDRKPADDTPGDASVRDADFEHRHRVQSHVTVNVSKLMFFGVRYRITHLAGVGRRCFRGCARRVRFFIGLYDGGSHGDLSFALPGIWCDTGNTGAGGVSRGGSRGYTLSLVRLCSRTSSRQEAVLIVLKDFGQVGSVRQM